MRLTTSAEGLLDDAFKDLIVSREHRYQVRYDYGMLIVDGEP